MVMTARIIASRECDRLFYLGAITYPKARSPFPIATVINEKVSYSRVPDRAGLHHRLLRLVATGLSKVWLFQQPGTSR